VDTNLYRSAVSQLRTDGEFLAGKTIRANSADVNMVTIGDVFNNGFPVIAFGNSLQEYIYRTAPGVLTASAAITSQGVNGGFTYNPAALGGLALASTVQGEANHRFYIDYGGFHRWGDGAVAPDISLYRSSANALAITGNLTVEKAVAGGTALPSNNFAFYTGFSEGAGIAFLIRNQGRLEWGDGVGGALDTILYRSGAGQLSLQGTLTLSGNLHGGAFYSTFLYCSGVVQVVSPADNWAYIASFNGDAQQRLLIYNSGKITWGDGVAGPDTNLYRESANFLKTDGSLRVMGTIFAQASWSFQSFLPGDTNQRIGIYVPQSAIYFGPGNAAEDTSLARLAPGVLGVNGVAISTGSSAVGYGTALPASPSNGQEYILVDSVSNPSYQWRFRYNASSGSAYKWEFVGGTRLITPYQQYHIDSSIINMGQIAAPRSGEYRVHVNVWLENKAGGTGDTYARLNVAGTDVMTQRFSGNNATLAMAWTTLGLAAGQVVMGRGDTNGDTWFRSNTELIPLRVA
jgi:hypothetical protein